ncbi:hypothetical protein [Bacteroides sp. An269]|uniref:hypothetical protein n=1 Tax=Bacteroides sp. An269 TaxID=1965613 RepID=UPI000B575177|nr:hypothetical protein [Bacteroides sp. An269]OUO85289.1 hypothetical protein B5F71_00625 [Bacteroides sp. An269]
MENLSRMVIDLYKQSFTDYVNGNTVNVDAILEAQEAVSNAIIKARIENTVTEFLEHLKADIDYLKYQIL